MNIVIMAHPKRKTQAEALANKLDCDIVWDENNDEWATGRKALLSAKSEWHCILQDDCIVGDNFKTNLHNAIEHVPTKSLISLYTGTVRPQAQQVSEAIQKAKQLKASWIRHNMLLWGVGIVIPTADIPPLLDFVKWSRLPYDFRIGIYYRNRKKPVYYLQPSIVNHNWRLPSLTKHGILQREAHNYSDDVVEWNRKVVEYK